MRRRLSLRGRMVTTAVVAAGVALAVLVLLAGPPLDRRAHDDAFRSLTAEARLMARVVEDELARGAGLEGLDPVVDATAREVDARVTVITPDGRVLADSAVSGGDLERLENHGNRPEVIGALAGTVSRAERRSATVRTELLYAAVPVRSGSRVVGVARLSQGIGSIEAQARSLWRAGAVALLLALLATALLSVLLSAPLGRSLEEIMEAARQFAAGNLSARIRVRRDDELGELARIINQSADQLQSRMAEIARDRGRTDAILSAMDDGLLAVDHRGTVALANPSLTRTLDLREPVGRHYLEVIRQREVGVLVEEVLRDGERREAEVEILHLRRVFTISAVPFPGEKGAPPGVVLTFNDTTERHRVERIRRDFVANASHELRTPLTSIRGFVEALEDGALSEPETAARFLGKIRTHADRMTTLVEDLLELSRLESGDREPEWEAVRPAGVAEGVTASFAALAARKGISLRHVDRGAPGVHTDPERLRRILENLVDNAVKYTPEGGRVEVTTSAGPDDSARVEVADDGPGIAAEHQARVFERFYRVDKARSRELGGTGLGLSIVRHLAESVRASVSVESEPGKGSRFIVTLPGKPVSRERVEPA
ncbi:MAG TPA: ATP-binding protein [Vicinamibacteria bacterium]|nr:ATP-binding protein [Vicinamibacteria bacterium]